MGCSFLQRYISEEEFQCNDLIFVAPTVHSHGFVELESFFKDTEFDIPKIQSSVRNLYILGGGKDYITKKEFEDLAHILSAEFLFFPEQGHFSHYKALFPEIKNFCKKYFAIQ